MSTRAGPYLLIVALAMLAPLAALAQRTASPIELVAHVGFDGLHGSTQIGAWNPVYVHVSNNTDRDIFGTLKFATVTASGEPGGSRIARPVHLLPHQQRLLVRTCIFVEQSDTRLDVNFAGDHGEASYTAEALLASMRNTRAIVVLGEAELHDITRNATFPHEVLREGANSGEGETYAIAGQPLDQATSYGEERSRWRIFHAPVEALPDRWIGYGGVSAVVLTEPGVLERLDPPQFSALQDWVGSGGRLVFELPDAGAGEAALRSPRASTLIPCVVESTRNVDAQEVFGAFTSETGEPRPMQVAVLGKVEGAEVVAVHDQPILATRASGLGFVTAAGFNLADARLTSPDNGYRAILGHVFAPHAGEEADCLRRQNAAQVSRDVDMQLKSEDFAQIPSHRMLLVFLALYCLLVGPINRGLWSLMRRPLTAWLVMPFIVATFISIAMAKMSITRPSEPLMREITVVQAREGDTSALARSYLSLYSPDRRTYRIDLPQSSGALHYLVASEHRGLDRELLWFADGVGADAFDAKATSPDEIRAAASWRLDQLALAPRSTSNLEAMRRLRHGIGLAIQSRTDRLMVTHALPVAIDGGLYWDEKNTQFEFGHVNAGDSAVLIPAPNRSIGDLANRSERDRKVIATIARQLRPTAISKMFVAWSASSVTDLKVTAGSGGAPVTSSPLTFYVQLARKDGR